MPADASNTAPVPIDTACPAAAPQRHLRRRYIACEPGALGLHPSQEVQGQAWLNAAKFSNR